MSNLTPKQKTALKLLGENREYQTYFFKRVRDVKWFIPLKKKGYFNASRNPKPIPAKEKGFYTIPHWPALDYLEKLSVECSKSENRQLAEELLQIIRGVSNPTRGKKSDNFRTWWFFVKILSNLPTDIIRLKDIELVANWLDSKFDTGIIGIDLGTKLLPRLLESSNPDDAEKALVLLEIATRVRQVKQENWSIDNLVLLMDTYSLESLFKKNAELLGRKCGKQAIPILERRIEETIATNGKDQYRYILRPAIEDHPQNHDGDYANILISALRDITLHFCKPNPIEGGKILEHQIADSSFTIRRVAIYVFNRLFGTYKPLFLKNLKPELFDISFKHEMFELLRNHFNNLTYEEQDQLLDIIDKLTLDWREGVDAKLAEAQLRLDWLQAIKEQENKRVDELLQKYSQKGVQPSKRPDFASYSESFSGEVSPLQVEDILLMSNEKIADYLVGFKESDSWRAPSEMGLAGSLGNAIKQKPEKFELDLRAFAEVKSIYQQAIISSFEELWRQRKEINWEKLLAFCSEIVGNENFWKRPPDTNKYGEITTGWVTSPMCRLIESGVNDDRWVFDETFLPLAEKILFRIMDKELGLKQYDDDMISIAINTAKGNAISAVIQYSLRVARLLDGRQENRDTAWQRVQVVLNKELDSCKNENFEFSALCGLYLPNLYYLNKEWVKEHIDLLFSSEYESNWRSAIQGYAGVGTFYKNIYLLLKEHGDFERALVSKFKTDFVREKIVQSISTAYLFGMESTESPESLFAKVLAVWNEDDIREIISVFWMYRDSKLSDEVRDRILEFWGFCYEKIGREKTLNKSILSDLNLLAVFLKEISATEKQWLSQAIDFVDENHNSSFYLDYLDEIATKDLDTAADLLKIVIENKTPIYKGEKIHNIVTKLYDKGGHQKERADQIVDLYSKNYDPELLQPLFWKNRNPKVS